MTPPPSFAKPSLPLRTLVLACLLLAALGGLLLVHYARGQEARDLLVWQTRLNLIADSRAEAVQGWLAEPRKALGAIAANPSVQLYLAGLETPAAENADAPAPTPAPTDEEPMQRVFLRNLLVTQAAHLGFLPHKDSELAAIPANLARPQGTGLAFINAQERVLVSTAGLGALDEALKSRLPPLPEKAGRLIDFFSTPEGGLRMGFLFPVFPIQAEAESKPLAWLLAVKEVPPAFFALLRHPGATENGLEAALLRREDGNAVFLSPSSDSAPLQKRLTLAMPSLDAAFALDHTGLFATKRNAGGATSLMTSRAIEGTPWTLMLHIPRESAMKESERWLRQTVWTMAFALLALLGGMLAAWHYGSSRRSTRLLDEAQRLTSRLGAQEKLLRLVADTQLEPVLLVDAQGHVRFANEKAASLYGIRPEDLSGKTLPALMGPAAAKPYEDANAQALDKQAPLVRCWQKGEHAIQSVHIPLLHMPLDKETTGTGVLMIDQDITGPVDSRERKLGIQHQLVSALVHLVDERDSFAAHHSSAVAFLARLIAQEMNLPESEIETAETAGRLMNIGKIAVPETLLGKELPLDEEETRLIQDSLKRASLLLEGIAFEGPVLETLRQMQEHYDGTGPTGLKGNEILLPARLIAVANAFIGMISPRAYRTAMEIDAALKILLGDGNSRYDGRIVLALANAIENRQGKEKILALTLS